MKGHINTKDVKIKGFKVVNQVRSVKVRKFYNSIQSSMSLHGTDWNNDWKEKLGCIGEVVNLRWCETTYNKTINTGI